MSTNNRKLAQIFRDMSNMYAFTGASNRFRTIAYERAAQMIGSMKDDLSAYSEKELEALKGIGHGIATKIEEFIATGRIRKYEELKKEIPLELVRLTSLSGIGPKTLKLLNEQLHITNKDELAKALRDGSILELPGFGKKRVENMIRGLEIHNKVENRILLWDAQTISDDIVEQLKKLKEIKNLEVAGSIRRRKETIGDIDILASCKTSDRQKIVSYFTKLDVVQDVLVKGDTKASIRIIDSDRQVDLRLVEPSEWGAALVYFTGSKQHNIHIRSIAKDKGLKVSEYGVFKTRNNRKIAGKTEEEVYKSLGLKWVPPEMREDNGEIELVQKGRVPKLITLDDIKGDLQSHSTWSDGTKTIKDIADFVRKNYDYEYLGITDHSKSLRVAGGLTEADLRKQRKEIDEINKAIGKDFIKAGVEVEILSDGKLDISDKLLKSMDWVVAAIHTGLSGDNTERLIEACKNPNVHVIGHPTGRMIGTRDAYKVDMDKLIKAARETGTALEINCQPERMDLNEAYARKAMEAGVYLVISTDSHTPGNFEYMRLGVDIARRAWCTKEKILNTRSWKEIQKFTAAKKSRLQ